MEVAVGVRRDDIELKDNCCARWSTVPSEGGRRAAGGGGESAVRSTQTGGSKIAGWPRPLSSRPLAPHSDCDSDCVCCEIGAKGALWRWEEEE